MAEIPDADSSSRIFESATFEEISPEIAGVEVIEPMMQLLESGGANHAVSPNYHSMMVNLTPDNKVRFTINTYKGGESEGEESIEIPKLQTQEIVDWLIKSGLMKDFY